MSGAWHILSDTERRRAYDEDLDDQLLEAELRRDTPRCRKCGGVALVGFMLCVRCGLAERVRESSRSPKDAREQAPKPAGKTPKDPRAPKSTKTPKKRRPPKTSPEQQRYEAEVEHLGDPDFYDDLIGRRRVEDYASGTGKYDGDSLLEALISEASIRSAFEGRPPKSADVSQKGSTIVFSDGDGSEIRLHVDPDALKDMSRNLRTADRLLRQIRRLFGSR